jgi:hypothetical protein
MRSVAGKSSEGRIAMNIRRVVPDINSDRIEESRDFYAGFLGFQIAMDMGWVITFSSRSNPTAQVTVMRGEQTGVVRPQMSIEVDDVGSWDLCKD